MAEGTLSREERLARAGQRIEDYAAAGMEKMAEKFGDLNASFESELSGLTKEQIRYSPGEGQWSVNEVCRHVIRSLNGGTMLSVALAAGKPPKPNPDAKMGAMIDDTEDFDAIRSSLLAAFEQAVESAGKIMDESNLDAVFPHPFFGERNCREWVGFNVMHMEIHLNQVRRIKSSESYPV